MSALTALGSTIVFDCHGAAVAEDIIKRVPSSVYIVVSDKTVFPLYAQPLIDFITSSQKKCFHKILEPGEQSKCRQVKAEVIALHSSNHAPKGRRLDVLLRRPA